jgi:hypothetical protein
MTAEENIACEGQGDESSQPLTPSLTAPVLLPWVEPVRVLRHTAFYALPLENAVSGAEHFHAGHP